MSPAAAPPLEDDNLLSEILLRLPPLPSTLPRASLVCKRWRLLVSDPGFVRRFREHHRHSPPLLGYLIHDSRGISYDPIMDPPDRVPAGRLSLQLDHGYGFSLLGCQHGLVLISHDLPRQILVWDPVTGDQHRIAFPPWVDGIKNQIHGAVLRAAGEAGHFQVVLVQASIWDKQHLQVLACVYSSETGGWGDLILTPIPAPVYCMGLSAVLVGNSFYWRLAGCFCAVLEFDLERQSLAVIQVPVGEGNSFTVMRAEGGGLGLLSLSGLTAQLWKRNTDCDGVASWGKGRTIQLDKLLSPYSHEIAPLFILGFAHENNVVFLTGGDGVIMVQLESLQSKQLCRVDNIFDQHHHAFESVYAAGIGIGGEHDGAELVGNPKVIVC
ncbi:hypothetical protein CFC21_081936 [Triticum aestivum]|uniref:F-box domain-containing protein n=2 Tax=Triticum aestivum TaxID=4565 RepID=A0A9R1L4G8_WHEAT|nr:F-box/kelch-repeat protein At3g17530-like [Triticum aestivum]KAF7077377.1 hypothetical protein CFC21_081936 [Triticum aestivum]